MRWKLLAISLSLLSASIAFGGQDESDADSAVSIVVDFESGDAITLRRVNHGDAEIKVDGHVSEAIWAELPVFGAYKVTEPDTLVDPPYATRLRMFYTEKGIYASFDLDQPSDTIVARHAPRDSFEVSRDTIGINLDSSGSGRYGYWMTLALGDGQMDGTILPERQYSVDWDGAWYGATQRTENGWSAEFFVPWGQMAMPKGQETRRIGLHSSRKVAHLNERWSWPALPNSQPRFMSLFQPLEIAGVNPRQQWSVFPYVSSTFDRASDRSRYRAGVDLFWRPSSNFQGTATINPDFGAVESDKVDVNLTADETFFPEKRLFFLEGIEIFETTPRANNDGRSKFTIVNTRRIGARPVEPDLPPDVEIPLREELRPVDLIGATKATGQIGSIRYGALVAFEDETVFSASDANLYTQSGRNFGTTRILYEDSHNAAYRGLGFVSTIVTHEDADAVVHGADGHFLSTSGKWRFDAQLARSDRDETGIGYGTLLDVEYVPRQGLKHSLALTDFDDLIDVNDFGFQRRNDETTANYKLEWIKSGLTRIRDTKITPFMSYGRNGEGLMTSGGIGSGYEFNLNNRDKINGSASFFPARYDDRNSFGNGTYRIVNRGNIDVNYRTDQSKPLSVRGRVGWNGGDLYSGDLSLTGELDWRPSENLSINFELTYKDIDGWVLHQQDKDFTTFKAKRWEPEFSVEYYPTAFQQFRIAFQWIGIRAEEDRFYRLEDDGYDLIEIPKPPGESDDFSVSSLNFQIRYRWQIAPLSDLFIVYTKADSNRTDLMEFNDLLRHSWQYPLADQLVIKLRYRIGS